MENTETQQEAQQPEPETQPETQQPEPETQAQSEAQTETQPEADAETETEPEADAEAETDMYMSAYAEYPDNTELVAEIRQLDGTLAGYAKLSCSLSAVQLAVTGLILGCAFAHNIWSRMRL